ncbi:MAG: tripartite tricarboxylate transporter substrate binding protein [Betaproteobacteria bacterium]
MQLSVSILMVASIALVCASQPALAAAAAEYPVKPVRVIVPFAPGGTNDVAARIVAEKFSERFAQSFVVDNRAGANGVVGAEIVARAAPDGYTLLVASAGIAVNPSIMKSLPYDTQRDFTPLGMVGGGPYLMVVHPAIGAKTVKEFVAWTKARPAQISYASVGVGSPSQLAAELLRMVSDIDMQHVPYKGGSAALPDLIAGRVAMFFGSISTLNPQMQAGRLRAIAVTTLTRSPALPEVPTFVESGFPGFEVNGWYGLLGPAKMPAVLVARLNAELQKVLAAGETQTRFAANGMEPAGGTAAAFDERIRNEMTKWAQVVHAAGIKPE